MSHYTIVICDRCKKRIGPDMKTANLPIIIPGQLTGTDMDSECRLSYCEPCQPFVSALLAGLFTQDVIATRPERDLPHGTPWYEEPIDLAAEMNRYASLDLTDYPNGGLLSGNQ